MKPIVSRRVTLVPEGRTTLSEGDVLARGGGEGLEEQVLALHLLLLHEVVHEGRFAHVRIAHQGNYWRVVVAALRLLLGNLTQPSLLLDIPADPGLLVPELPALHLELGLALATHGACGPALLGRDDLHLYFLHLHEVSGEEVEGGGVGGSVAH